MNTHTFAEALLARDGFLILSHRRPDGDTLGSGAALCSALRRMGKTAYIYRNPQTVPRQHAYVGVFEAPAGFLPQCTVAVDIATPGLFPLGYGGTPDFCVDHHPSNSGYAPLTLLNGDRSSCGEIVSELIETMTGSITPEEATLLYIAVTTDCGCFQYMNTNADTLRTAAHLIDCGARHHDVVHDFFRKVSRARVLLEGAIFSGMRFYRDGKVTVAVVTKQLLADCGAEENDCEDLAGLPGRIESSVVSVLVRELDSGESKISVRTTPEVDACAVCAHFGGGGHAMAAGCTLDCDPDTAVERLLAAIDAEWPA